MSGENQSVNWKRVTGIAAVTLTALIVSRSIYFQVATQKSNRIVTPIETASDPNVAKNMDLVKPLLQKKYGMNMEAFNLTADPKYQGIDDVTVLLKDGSTVKYHWNEGWKQLFN